MRTPTSLPSWRTAASSSTSSNEAHRRRAKPDAEAWKLVAALLEANLRLLFLAYVMLAEPLYEEPAD